MASLQTDQQSGVDEPQGSIHLTRREVEVLTLITEGRPSQQVAKNLYISRRTVDFHLANIYQKLEVSNRAQAFFEASRRGLISAADMSAIRARC